MSIIIAFHLDALVRRCQHLTGGQAELVFEAVKEACINDQRWNEAVDVREHQKAAHARKRSEAATKANRTRKRSMVITKTGAVGKSFTGAQTHSRNTRRHS